MTRLERVVLGLDAEGRKWILRNWYFTEMLLKQFHLPLELSDIPKILQDSLRIDDDNP